MKFLFVFLLLGFLFWFVRRRLWTVGRDSCFARRVDAYTEMNAVRCAYCGVYFLEADGFVSRGHRYCSRAHHDLAQMSGACE